VWFLEAVSVRTALSNGAPFALKGDDRELISSTKGVTMKKLDKVIYTVKAHTTGGLDKGRGPILRRLAGVLGVAVIVTLFGVPSATSADNGLPFPNGFRDWFVVNSMNAGKDSPVFGYVDGMHLIHVMRRDWRL